MDIVVCVKRPPKTAARIKPGADGKTFDPSGVEYDINEYDKFAIEAAILLKEKFAGSKVTALLLGPKDATKELRNAIAMGADQAALLVHERPQDLDNWAIANALAAKIKTIKHDLVLFGQVSVDNQSSQTAQIVAELLGGYACATVVTGLEAAATELNVERELEGGKRERMTLKLPCVLSCQKGLNKPRSPSMKGIMASKNAKIDESPAQVTPNLISVLRMDPPAPRPAGKVVGEGADAAKKLVELLRNESKVI